MPLNSTCVPTPIDLSADMQSTAAPIEFYSSAKVISRGVQLVPFFKRRYVVTLVSGTQGGEMNSVPTQLCSLYRGCGAISAISVTAARAVLVLTERVYFRLL